jgi:hypothetical protein
MAKAIELISEYGSELVIDDGWYKGRRPVNVSSRTFWLDYFSFEYRLPTKKERFCLNIIEYCFKIQKLLKRRLFPIHFEQLLLDSKTLKTLKNVYLHGYWQQYSIASHMRNELKHRLNFCDGFFNQVHYETLQNISSDPKSVMVHVRCGDYIWDKKTNSAHGTCSYEYYVNAFNELRKRLNNPNIYLFSDDIAWAKAYLPLNEFSVTVINSEQHEEQCMRDLADFDLMRSCRHAVVANSSFSWWAAFLLKSEESIIIAPKKWHQSLDMGKIYDPDWITL